MWWSAAPAQFAARDGPTESLVLLWPMGTSFHLRKHPKHPTLISTTRLSLSLSLRLSLTHFFMSCLFIRPEEERKGESPYGAFRKLCEWHLSSAR